MKLHKDGTVEGTPQEIAEYNRLEGKQEIGRIGGYPFTKTSSPGDSATQQKEYGTKYTTVSIPQTKYQAMSMGDFYDTLFQMAADSQRKHWLSRNTH